MKREQLELDGVGEVSLVDERRFSVGDRVVDRFGFRGVVVEVHDTGHIVIDQDEPLPKGMRRRIINFAYHWQPESSEASRLEHETVSPGQVRTCAWCRGPIDVYRRSHIKTCSKACRQALHRFRVAPAAAATDSRALRVAYADPPYPGCARRYYAQPEVPHDELVDRLMREFPDGWALSTSAKALPFVLPLCPLEVRVCPWVRGSRRGVTDRARNAWEALIVYGGRLRRLEPTDELDDVLVLNNRPQRSHPGALVGMKPAAFAEWMFRLLGLLPIDELVDLFPGSGAVARAWAMYCSPSSSRRASKLEEASRHLRQSLERRHEHA